MNRVSDAPIAPLLLGVEGYALTAREREFIKARRPFGFLLFARNVDTPEQTRALCAELAEISAFPTPFIGVDQEGGRVQRVKFGGKLPPARAFGEWYAKDPKAALEAVRLDALLLAAQLRDVGATWMLGPVLDLGRPETHKIIGDRTFADDPQTVVTLAQAYAQGIGEGGCWDCLKHAPGHGRAVVDSHFELPVVEASREELAQDFYPFQNMSDKADFLMTAHIRYLAIDKVLPATYSPELIGMMRNDWGFNGVLLADDVGMKALGDDYVTRVTKSLAAGCDVAITALSVLRHGMAGTVFDEENFEKLCAADLPALNPRALAHLAGLTLPKAPDASTVERARSRLVELWADGPARMGYPLEL